MNDRRRLLSTVERKLFEKFFERLGAASIPAILLRNYEDFPAQIGHDLDVFFRRADLSRAVEVLWNVLRERGGEVLHIHKRDYLLAVWFRAAGDEPQVIHLDFYHGAFTWHGLSYLSENELLASSRNFGKFKVPRPAHEAVSLFLTSLLWGNFYKIRYRERIHSLLQLPGEAAEFSRLLGREFGPMAQPPVDFSDQPESASREMGSYAKRLRKSFKARSFLRRPLRSIFAVARYWWGEFRTVIRPPGLCIAILGPDGSGKSTVIQAVRERVEYYFGETVDRHWRPHFLRDIGVLLGKRAATNAPVSDPHGHTPHSVAVSAARFFYYWLDYWLGWPLRVWQPKEKNHLVIFDRYAQDMWCDPRRYRLNLPPVLMKVFCRGVPQPDITFVLLADAQVIHQRKGEVTLPALREMLTRYGEAARRGGNVHAVDCSRPVVTVADEIAASVLSRLKTKIARLNNFE
jgi:thymidylate kinase